MANGINESSCVSIPYSSMDCPTEEVTDKQRLEIFAYRTMSKGDFRKFQKLLDSIM